MNKDKIREIIDFVGEVGKLEATWRFSATFKDRKESVADHSWRLSLLSFLVADELKLNLNLAQTLKIAIVHDLAEALTGEIDAFRVITGEISKKSKDKNELKAIMTITSNFSFGKNIKELWQEYLDQATREAKYVRALDKLEAFLTILEAGHQEYKQNVFYGNYADEAVSNFAELEPLLAEVKKRLKKELSKGKIEWKE